jgi:hypothetical protein
MEVVAEVAVVLGSGIGIGMILFVLARIWPAL